MCGLDAGMNTWRGVWPSPGSSHPCTQYRVDAELIVIVALCAQASMPTILLYLFSSVSVVSYVLLDLLVASLVVVYFNVQAVGHPWKYIPVPLPTHRL